MTLQIASSGHQENWQRILQTSFHSPLELLQFLKLEPESVAWLDADKLDFPCRVPRPFAERMRVGDAADPLLRQALPLQQETVITSGFVDDPLAEAASSPVPGLIHKYHGRVLLVATGTCAINCRYCFRRHFPYEAHPASSDVTSAALEYIAADASISEVILSGGDPLLLSDRRVRALVEQLEAISHVRRLRIHTRLPVVLPQRVTPELCGLLQKSRLQVAVVVHANHANEIDQAVARACADLKAADILLLNQTVLLRGVSDDAESLEALSEALYDVGVLPYYLHLLDPVQGAAHFDVPEAEAVQIYRDLQAVLPGYLLPKLVREVAGGHSKEIRS